ADLTAAAACSTIYGTHRRLPVINPPHRRITRLIRKSLISAWRPGRHGRQNPPRRSIMAITPTGRPTREWPLLVLAVALVGAICIPVWHWSSGGELGSSQWTNWTPERLGRLLLGPEQIACYCCFTWAAFILFGRYKEVLRQQGAFRLGLLPTED